MKGIGQRRISLRLSYRVDAYARLDVTCPNERKSYPSVDYMNAVEKKKKKPLLFELISVHSNIEHPVGGELRSNRSREGSFVGSSM